MNRNAIETPQICVGDEFCSVVRRMRVNKIEASQRRGVHGGHLDGQRSVAGRACVAGRGTILVRRAAARPL